MNMAGFYARLAPSLIQIFELTLVIGALATILFGSRNAAGAGTGAGGRRAARASVDRAVDHHRAHVLGHHLDAAGMDAPRLGPLGRNAGSTALGHSHLLDEW